MALKGLRVVEMAGLAPAPLAGMILSDFGASVIRIDKPGQPAMDTLTRGKRSLCVSLKEPKGTKIVQELCSAADILIDPFRPGIMEKLGLGPDLLRELNPRLVYARLTGFGQTGPLSSRPGHDINYLAISGVLSTLGRSGSNPHPPINLLADFSAGSLMCVMGILMALYERFISGKGQVVDVAMSGGVAYLASFLTASQKIGLFEGERGTNLLDGGAHFYETYKTKDGGYMSVGAIEPKFYSQLLKGLGLESELPSGHQMDSSNWLSYKSLFAEKFATKTRDEWTEIFSKLEACVEPVLSLEEAANHPHNQHRGVYEQDIPSAEPRLSRTPNNQPKDCMQLQVGEHSVQILKEMGYSVKAITGLLESNLVYQSDTKSKL